MSIAEPERDFFLSFFVSPTQRDPRGPLLSRALSYSSQTRTNVHARREEMSDSVKARWRKRDFFFYAAGWTFPS